MDDIVQARKARMKLWNTSSEKVCEVQTLGDAGTSGNATRYTNRRYSDFVGSALAPIPAASLRRASEMPVPVTPSTSGAAKSPSQNFFKRTGIVVSNTDFKSLITSLASSATEINKVDDSSPCKSKPSTSSNTLAPDQGISRSNRSNSFDVSILHNAKQMVTGSGNDKSGAAALAGWFEKRHQPAMARKKSLRNTANVTVSFSKEVFDRFKEKEKEKERKPKSRLRWDNKSSFVDPHVIGNAIEGFLRKSTGKEPRSKRGATGSSSSSSSKPSTSSSGFWFGKSDEDDSKDTCDSSLCSTLKDLFVK